MCTNQGAIARGIFDEHQFWQGERRLEELLAAEGLKLDAVYFCPHHPTEGDTPYRQECDCRKPKPGMLLRGIREYGIDPAKSFMVGDSPEDIGAGKAAGVRVVKLTTTYGRGVAPFRTQDRLDELEGQFPPPDFRCQTLEEASHWILGQKR